VATISRLLEIIGFFCRISSLLQGSFAKETCNFKEPTNRSLHIASRHGMNTDAMNSGCYIINTYAMASHYIMNICVMNTSVQYGAE